MKLTFSRAIYADKALILSSRKAEIQRILFEPNFLKSRASVKYKDTLLKNGLVSQAFLIKPERGLIKDKEFEIRFWFKDSGRASDRKNELIKIKVKLPNEGKEELEIDLKDIAGDLNEREIKSLLDRLNNKAGTKVSI